MKKQVREEYKVLERTSQIFFQSNALQAGPYTSPNPIKRFIIYTRLLNLLKIFPFDLDKGATIIDFGAGQCIFSILLLALGYSKVISVDINEQSLRDGVSLLEFYNKTLGTNLSLDVSTEMPNYEISLVCAIDVFEHLTRERVEDIIRSNNSPRYLLNLPSENFLYDLGTGFHREPDHQMRYFEVLGVFDKCGYDVRYSKGFLGLFNGYLMERK